MHENIYAHKNIVTPPIVKSTKISEFSDFVTGGVLTEDSATQIYDRRIKTDSFFQRTYLRINIKKDEKKRILEDNKRWAVIRSHILLLKHKQKYKTLYDSFNNICLWAFRLESTRITAARIPRWWLKINKLKLETLDRMRTNIQRWASGHTRASFGVPLFSLEALRAGCCEKDIQCPCGSGRYMYVPGRCLVCKPINEPHFRAQLWKRIQEALDFRMGREKSSPEIVEHDGDFCYLRSWLWTERSNRARVVEKKRYTRATNRISSPSKKDLQQ